jgi:hypothetical protein
MNKRFGDDPFDEFDKLIRAAAGAEPSAAPSPKDEPPTSPPSALTSVVSQARTAACPYLGIIDDPTSRFMGPDLAHRCFATRRATLNEMEHQTVFCLAAKHRSCEVFLAMQRQGGPVDDEPESWFGRLWRALSTWRRP